MADYWALSAGNWSNVSNWLTGTTPGQRAGELPGPLDDVYANNRTVVIDVSSVQINLMTTAAKVNVAAAGGEFRPNNNVTIRANSVIAGTTTCVTFVSASPSFFNIDGGSIRGGSAANAHGITNSSTGSIFITGNVGTGSANPTYGILNPSSGRIFLSGSVTTSNLNMPGILNGGSGTVTVQPGRIIEPATGNSQTITNSFIGTINYVGDLFAPIVQYSTIISNRGTGTINVTGNITNSRVDTSATAISNLSTGVVNIIGNMFGDTGPNNYAIENNGTVNVSGTLIGGYAGNIFNGCITNGTGTVNITGSVIGGFGTGDRCITNNGTGTINIFGTCSGGQGTNSYGCFNSTTGTVNVFGTSIGGPGSGAHGVYNNSNNGVVYVARVVGNGFGIFCEDRGAAVGLFNNALSGRCYVGEIDCGSRGVFPVGGTGPIWLSGNKNTKAGYSTGSGRITTIALCANSDYQPKPGDVRFDLYYDTINNPDPPFGFLYMPKPNQVANSTLVDNTTGTATFENPEQIWNVSVFDTGLFIRNPEETTPETYDFSFGNRLRNSLTLNNLSSIAVSLNNQTRLK